MGTIEIKPIGTYQSPQVFWFDYNQFQLDRLKKDWLRLATSDIAPSTGIFNNLNLEAYHDVTKGLLNNVLRPVGKLFSKKQEELKLLKKYRSVIGNS